MINFKNKNILITGASGGIGNELVKKFISLEGNVLATGTNAEKLDKLKPKHSYWLSELTNLLKYKELLNEQVGDIPEIADKYGRLDLQDRIEDRLEQIRDDIDELTELEEDQGHLASGHQKELDRLEAEYSRLGKERDKLSARPSGSGRY